MAALYYLHVISISNLIHVKCALISYTFCTSNLFHEWLTFKQTVGKCTQNVTSCSILAPNSPVVTSYFCWLSFAVDGDIDMLGTTPTPERYMNGPSKGKGIIPCSVLRADMSPSLCDWWTYCCKVVLSVRLYSILCHIVLGT